MPSRLVREAGSAVASPRDLSFVRRVNRAADAGAVMAAFDADSRFGTAGDRDSRAGLAAWLVRIRDGLYGGAFTSVEQIAGVYDKMVRPSTTDPDALLAEHQLEPEREQRILRFLNAATPEEIQQAVPDDPNFGLSSPRAYGIRSGLAAWIVHVRDELYGGRFSRLAEVVDIYGVGPDTTHDLLAALYTPLVEIPLSVVRRLQTATRVVVVTGAGVSEPSSVPAMSPENLSTQWTPRAFAQDVEASWEFHLGRRDEARNAEPNDAHREIDAMARWVLGKPEGAFTLVTQNQDRLHHRAAGTTEGEPASGAYPIIELHGHLFQGRCSACGEVFDLPDTLAFDRLNDHTLPTDQVGPRYFVCSACNGMARPTVQWLTEPYARGTLDVAGAAVMAADVVLFLGTSGRVPAVRWLLHEAHWHARAYTIVVDAAPELWRERDGTPDWPGSPIVDAAISAHIVAAMQSLQAAVGWEAGSS